MEEGTAIASSPRLAIGRICSPRIGTAFAISERMAITAFHCVGDRTTGEIPAGRVEIDFFGQRVSACVSFHDLAHDLAVLSLDNSLPASVRPVRLARQVVRHSKFVAIGWPDCRPFRNDPYEVTGAIVDDAATVHNGVVAIQLFCDQGAAGQPLTGFSGAPILIETKRGEAAIGVVRCSPDSNGTGQADGGTVYAASTAHLLTACSRLECEIVDDGPFSYVVSYCSSIIDIQWGRWVAAEIAKAVPGVFARDWYLAPGDNFADTIEPAFRAATAIYVIVSPRYQADRSEVHLFEREQLTRRRDARLVPVVVEEAAIPDLLKYRSAVDISDRDEENARLALAGSLRPKSMGPSREDFLFPGKRIRLEQRAIGDTGVSSEQATKRRESGDGIDG